MLTFIRKKKNTPSLRKEAIAIIKSAEQACRKNELTTLLSLYFAALFIYKLLLDTSSEIAEIKIDRNHIWNEYKKSRCHGISLAGMRIEDHVNPFCSYLIKHERELDAAMPMGQMFLYTVTILTLVLIIPIIICNLTNTKNLRMAQLLTQQQMSRFKIINRYLKLPIKADTYVDDALSFLRQCDNKIIAKSPLTLMELVVNFLTDKTQAVLNTFPDSIKNDNGKYRPGVFMSSYALLQKLGLPIELVKTVKLLGYEEENEFLKMDYKDCKREKRKLAKKYVKLKTQNKILQNQNTKLKIEKYQLKNRKIT